MKIFRLRTNFTSSLRPSTLFFVSSQCKIVEPVDCIPQIMVWKTTRVGGGRHFSLWNKVENWQLLMEMSGLRPFIILTPYPWVVWLIHVPLIGLFITYLPFIAKPIFLVLQLGNQNSLGSELKSLLRQKNEHSLHSWMSILIHLKALALLTATTGKTLFSRILVECLHTILYLVNNRRSALLQL